MRHFKPAEFNHLDKMDATFLKFLDAVRHLANVPFYLTSDYRDPTGSTSLHGSGNAVDFATPGSRDRDAQTFYAELFDITWAVMDIHNDGIGNYRKVQLELVKGPTDWHVHLGLYPEGWTGESKLIVATD